MNNTERPATDNPIRTETPAERAKWLDFYRELDFLVAEGEAERQHGW